MIINFVGELPGREAEGMCRGLVNYCCSCRSDVACKTPDRSHGRLVHVTIDVESLLEAGCWWMDGSQEATASHMSYGTHRITTHGRDATSFDTHILLQAADRWRRTASPAIIIPDLRVSPPRASSSKVLPLTSNCFLVWPPKPPRPPA